MYNRYNNNSPHEVLVIFYPCNNTILNDDRGDIDVDIKDGLPKALSRVHYVKI